MERKLNSWGWGYEDARLPAAELAPTLAQRLGFGSLEVEAPALVETIVLPPPRVASPYSASTADRVRHACGRSYIDTVRALRGQFPHPPDAVAFPACEQELEAALEWAGAANVAVIPYGGGTSVVGGVEPRVPSSFDGVLSVDLSRMKAVLEVDDVSRAALIEAGANGPQLEAQLAQHGLTLRFFPQSFELASLGGMIATRAGGHFAVGETHVDGLVQSIRAIAPTGAWESRRLPSSGAGPSPDRLLIGSEGSLGVIVRAWMRLRARPLQRASCAVRFESFLAGASAVRALVQSGLQPANCRLLDPLEADLTGLPAGGGALLMLGFEGGAEEYPAAALLRSALAICAGQGGRELHARANAATADGAGTVRAVRTRQSAGEQRSAGRDAMSGWRAAFLAMPYLRDALVQCGVLSETFETAITWDRLPDFHEAVVYATTHALGEPCRVSCRLTHVYSDGAAPYYTVLAPARRGGEVEQWQRVKAAASEAILAAGGTITHHHAVGRDHMPFYARQRPEQFSRALRASKAALDPAGILNPGVLI